MSAKRASAMMAIAFLAGGLWAVDLSLDTSILTSVNSAIVAIPSLEEHVQLGQSFGESIYAKVELSHSNLLFSPTGSRFSPRSSDVLATLEYISDLGMAGITGALHGMATSVSGASLMPGYFEVGAFAKGSLPLMGDLASVDGELRAASDFAGLLGTFKAAPTLYLPLSSPVMLSLGTKLVAALGNYENSNYSGFGIFELKPAASMSLDRAVTIGIAAGYVFDFSGFRLLSQGSYPFAEVGASFSLSSPSN